MGQTQSATQTPLGEQQPFEPQGRPSVSRSQVSVEPVWLDAHDPPAQAKSVVTQLTSMSSLSQVLE